MSIRPVDLQVILPHATDAGKVQANQNTQSNTMQQVFAEKLQKEAQLKQNQVQESPKGEFGKVNRDKEKEDSHSKKQKKEKEENSNMNLAEETYEKDLKTKRSLNPVIGNNLDISS